MYEYNTNSSILCEAVSIHYPVIQRRCRWLPHPPHPPSWCTQQGCAMQASPAAAQPAPINRELESMPCWRCKSGGVVRARASCVCAPSPSPRRIRIPHVNS